MSNKKLELVYTKEITRNREFKILSIKQINEFPEDIHLETEPATTLFSSSDLSWYKNLETAESFEDSDYRFLLATSLDGKYVEVSELCYEYAKKHLNSGLFIYDPIVELEEK